MTREELIKRLSYRDQFNKPIVDNIGLGALLDEAITMLKDDRQEMANELLKQIEKLFKEPPYYMPNYDAYALFKKMVEDYRDRKGAWAEKEIKHDNN